MISAILGAIGSMVGFTAIGMAENELREYLGRMTRPQLNRLNARLSDIRTRVQNKKSLIQETISALQASGIGVTSAATASKLREKRTKKVSELKKQQKGLDAIEQGAAFEQALADQRTADSYTYGGVISEAISGKDKTSQVNKKISGWEDALK